MTNATPCALPALNDDERTYMMALIEAYRDAAVDTESALNRGDKAEWRRCYGLLVRLHNDLRTALGFPDTEPATHP